MSFQSGKLTFRQFIPVGNLPTVPTQELLDRLAAHALKTEDFGVPEEVVYGWSGGRHIYDGAFSFENNVYGEAIHFALRVDTNKVPSPVSKAMREVEEAAMASLNPSGFISKLQKTEARDAVAKRIEVDLRDRKYQKSRLIPVLWDLARGRLYANVSGTFFEKLAEIFQRTFGLDLVPVTAGMLGRTSGCDREYEDLRPTRFVSGPEGEGQHPEYPWVLKGAEPKNFLGNEFLLWLWHEADNRTGVISTPNAGDVTIYIDRVLKLDCAYGQTGKDTIHGDGVSRTPESREALRLGKLPRSAGFIIDAGRQQFSFVFDPEQMTYSGAKFPDIEDADTPRVVFEERIKLIADLVAAVEGMYAVFLECRLTSEWEQHRNCISKWIGRDPKPSDKTIAAALAVAE